MVKCQKDFDELYTFVFLILCFTNINGEAQRVSNTTLASATAEPVEDDVYQTDGFSNDTVKSGPILIIDKKTIFISDLHYQSNNKETYFWVGTGIPSPQGSLVPLENNLEGSLGTYDGQNIYLQLPNNWTTDKIDYIAIWSNKEKTDLGHVKLYQNVNDTARKSIPEAAGFHNKTKQGKTIFRIPGCCGRNELNINRTCTKVDEKITTDLKVFESNETHIDPDVSMKDIEFVPYKYFIDCPPVGYEAFVANNEDVRGLIYNGSLIYYFSNFDYGLLSHGPFCISYPNATTYKVYLCLKSITEQKVASIQYLYFPLLVISTLCFLGSDIVYIFILKPKDVHRKCFIGYATSMVVAYISLICLQKLDAACNFWGGLFLFFMMCSFVWLACICVDLIFITKFENYFEDQTRIFVYLGLSSAIPAIILASSVIPHGVPDVPGSFVKPYYGTSTCNFGEVNVLTFFIPVGLLIIVSIIGLGYSSYIINARNDPTDYEWRRCKKNIKFIDEEKFHKNIVNKHNAHWTVRNLCYDSKQYGAYIWCGLCNGQHIVPFFYEGIPISRRFRSCFLVWVTTIIWLIQALVNLIQMGSAAHVAVDLIEALQGVFVTIIFVLNKYTRKEINRIINEEKNKVEDQKRYADLATMLANDEGSTRANT